MILHFDKRKRSSYSAFELTSALEGKIYSRDELGEEILKIEKYTPSRAIAKADSFALILEKGAIYINKSSIFQFKIIGEGLLAEQRFRWESEIKAKYLKAESESIRQAWSIFGAYDGMGDYGHTSPNTRLLLSEGFSGILTRVKKCALNSCGDNEKEDFYHSCEIVLEAIISAAHRFADKIEPYNAENARALRQISSGAPTDIYEALQLLIFYFYIHEYIGGTRIRTLGRLDLLLQPFYENAIKSDAYTKKQIFNMLKFFLYTLWIMEVPYDIPFCLGGLTESGADATSEISYMIIEAYDSLNIHSPKIHIRTSDKTPKNFIKRVLRCIRKGNSSFVLFNDRIGIEALRRVGISEHDSIDYVPIGCYEPAVWGVEMGCTGNGGVNLAKAVELVLNNGCDQRIGWLVGVNTPLPQSFAEFVEAVKVQIRYMTKLATDYIVKIERHYKSINPDPLLSAQYENSVNTGVDVYDGGAKYNNSSLYFYSLASLVDSICAVKTLVFDKKLFTLSELCDILRLNWNGYERERLIALNLEEKYGNGNTTADALTAELSEFCATLINNMPNGRGGVFKAALFSINHFVHLGERTAATPDGRYDGEPLSKNLCATVGMDRRGVSALINSVTKIDFASFPTGSVLDIMLHPSAVSGREGLEAFGGVVMTYFKKGGFAMHANIFDLQTLRDAQLHPHRYKGLQVRVCGWNAYFVNLSRTEQECFIKQAEGLL